MSIKWQDFDVFKVSPIILSAISVLVAVSSLVVASLGYLSNRDNTEELNNRFNNLGKIYLQSRMEKTSLEITSLDNDKHILNMLVQYPAGAFHGVSSMEGTMGGGGIDFDSDLQRYMLTRYEAYTGQKRPFPIGQVGTAFVPIIINTTYTFGGEPHFDRSVYLLSYVVASVSPSADHSITLAQPTSIVFCGHLHEHDPSIDFLADPWLPMPLGEPNRPSMAALANCAPPMANSDKVPGSRTTLIWVSLPPGQFEIISNLSDPGVKRRGQGAIGGFAVDARDIRIRNLTGKPTSAQYAFSYAD